MDRNRLRRRLREAARMDHAVAGAADRVVSVTRNGANATFRQLRAELRNVISRQDAAR